MAGWRGNDLGLLKWQVMFVHDERIRMVGAVSDLCASGVPFQEARKRVTDRARQSWAYLAPNVREAMNRCAGDIRYADLDPAVKDHDEARLLTALGRRNTWLRRFLFRATGIVW